MSNVRERLGLSTEEFAILLGVSATTAYRWERAGYDMSRIDPFQRKLLLILEDIDPKVAIELGGKIRNATLRGGNLRGLHVVLTHFYGANPL